MSPMCAVMVSIEAPCTDTSTNPAGFWTYLVGPALGRSSESYEALGPRTRDIHQGRSATHPADPIIDSFGYSSTLTV